ncbi:polysaccharide pyruvyl transferase family protein [Thalassotalea psychrophila]|uniref:Polysaccharide pyruvyl transferase family protein n=1 Tax=Thalassotalea psychrophila TaxID=3065647 RepID=A0ABY9TP99_9GAMM|nr:polysaccharide pyruvyl transferase family protein [Colwelliaceae bacterium SQ149]
MTNTAKALLVGFYGKQNLGDDALLLATAWANKHILKNEQAQCTASAPINLNDFKQTQATLKAKQKFPGQNRLLQYQLAWKSQQIVLGGGSVLHSAHDLNIKRLMLKLSSKFKLTSQQERQHMAVGVGIEAFADDKAEAACKKFLSECPFIGLRDKDSYQRAKQLSPDANISLTFDLAPLLLCHSHIVDYKKQLLSKPKFQRKRYGIAINLCSIPSDNLGNANKDTEQRIISQYAKLICKLLKTTEQHITLISLNAEPMINHNRLNDDCLLQKVKDTVAENTEDKFSLYRLHIIKYHGDPLNMVKILSTFKLVIAMRLHALILSYINKTPVIAINYHQKCQAWCQQIGIANQNQTLPENTDLTALLTTIHNGLKHGFTPPKLPVRTALQQSLKNWRLSDEQIEYYCRNSAL